MPGAGQIMPGDEVGLVTSDDEVNWCSADSTWALHPQPTALIGAHYET